MLPKQDVDSAAAFFHERFAALVDASGLSIRDVARQAGVGRSTIDGWKNGKALPQSRHNLIKVVRRLQAAVSAAGGHGDAWGTLQSWASLLRRAKEARDVRSYPPRRQSGGSARDAAIETERRARAIVATDRAMEALSGLLYLGGKPDWDRERRMWLGKDVPQLDADEQAAADEWEARRDEYMRIIHVASLDIGDAELKARLKESLRILQLWQGPMQYARQGEGRTRHLVTTEALEAIGAFRSGDPLPERSGEYLLLWSSWTFISTNWK